MTRKVYAYPRLSSGDIIIKAGKTSVRINFTGGYVDKKMSRPATYATADPIMQQIIENSDLFGKKIFLYRTYGGPETPMVAENDIEVAEEVEIYKPDVTEYPEVTTWEEAIKILKSIPGVKVASLRSKVSAEKVAKVNGVSFPNYNFE